MTTIRTEAVLTCPICHTKQEAQMTTNACQRFYKCSSCGEMLKPKEGVTVVYSVHMRIACVHRSNVKR